MGRNIEKCLRLRPVGCKVTEALQMYQDRVQFQGSVVWGLGSVNTTSSAPIKARNMFVSSEMPYVKERV